MAPGCFSPSSGKETSSSKMSNDTMFMMSPLDKSSTDDFKQEDKLLVVVTSSSKATETSTINETSLESYAWEINLDQIPLPSTPPPPLPSNTLTRSRSTHDDDEDSDDEDEEESDDEEEEDEEEEESEDEDEKKEGNHLKNDYNLPRLKSSGRKPNLIFADTADTFEILEQTIIKQKRLAKLKNTDLRRKVLLKRTFDLVLEIMDAENGFNDDEPDSPPTPAPVITQHTPVEPELITSMDSSNGLELELHPDPSSSMDDDDDMNETDSSTSTTLVKLVDLKPLDSTESSARVPRQLKRRSSASDDDEEDEDENDDDERTDETQLDDFYEYSTIHTNDQQLNYRHAVTSSSSVNVDLNIYVDNVEIEQNGRDKAAEAQSRSNHARKRLRA